MTMPKELGTGAINNDRARGQQDAVKRLKADGKTV